MTRGKYSTHHNHNHNHNHNHPQPPQSHHHLSHSTYHPPLNHRTPPLNLPIHDQNQPNYSDYERKLIDEVLYLHSLWHRGPPPSSSSFRADVHLRPNHTTHFKRTKKDDNETLISSSDKEWPVDEKKPAATDGPNPSGWPQFRAENKPVTRAATAQEQARAAAARVQLRAVESCLRLFEDDSDGEEEEDDGDDEEEVDFFENLFVDDAELRGFYERNCGGGGEGGGGGEFVCLVCGVIKNNVGRKYKNCVALVQHSITVSKTKKKKAHRAYGSVVCKVLGWDVNRLPSIPTSVAVEDVVMGDVSNQAGKDSTVGELGRDGSVAEPSQTERESIPDSLEKDNITNTNVVCTSEVTHGEGENREVEKPNDRSTVVDMEGDAANTSHIQPTTESTHNAIDENTNVGCVASAVTHTEAETHDSGKDEICSNSENVVSQTENKPDLNQEKAVENVGDECSVPGSKPSESESSPVGDDPYEQLPCLSGVFKIPE